MLAAREEVWMCGHGTEVYVRWMKKLNKKQTNGLLTLRKPIDEEEGREEDDMADESWRKEKKEGVLLNIA